MDLKPRYLAAAALLHVALFAMLFASTLFTRKIEAPAMIEAVLIADPRMEQARKHALEQQKRAEAEGLRQQQEQERLAERQLEREQMREEEQKREQDRKAAQEEQKKQQDQKRKEQEQLQIKQEAERQRQEEIKQKAAIEQQRQDEIKKKAAEEEAKKKAVEEARRKQEADERKRLIEAERKEQDRIRREREAEDQRRRDEMAALLGAEEADRAAAARTAAQQPWAAQIAAKIQRNWQRPPASAERFNCLVQIQQLPGGDVVSAKIIRSCGSAVLDRSVENAVLKASPLPSPSDPSLFDRNIKVTFCPTPDAC